MRVAVLIQCHKSPEQLNMLLDTMRHESITFFVHVDKKSSILPQIQISPDVIVLPEDQRVDVQWGLYSQVEILLKI